MNLRFRGDVARQSRSKFSKVETFLQLAQILFGEFACNSQRIHYFLKKGAMIRLYDLY